MSVLRLYSRQQTKLRPPGQSLSCPVLPREVGIIHSVCLKRGPVSLFLPPFLARDVMSVNRDKAASRAKDILFGVGQSLSNCASFK